MLDSLSSIKLAIMKVNGFFQHDSGLVKRFGNANVIRSSLPVMEMRDFTDEFFAIRNFLFLNISCEYDCVYSCGRNQR